MAPFLGKGENLINGIRVTRLSSERKKKIKSLFLYTSPQNDSRWVKDLSAKQNKNRKDLEEAKEEML